MSSRSLSALLSSAPAGVQAHVLPEARPDNPGGALFPACLVGTPELPLDAVTAWLQASQVAVEAVLLEHGALWLRGFPTHQPEAFDAVMESLGVAPKPYVGGAAVRFVVAGNVFTANESPSDQVSARESEERRQQTCATWHVSRARASDSHSLRQTIFFHHEMALVAHPPSRIAFCCDVPALTGGETTLLHRRDAASAHASLRFLTPSQRRAAAPLPPHLPAVRAAAPRGGAALPPHAE